MDSITVPAYAKVNLTLAVTGRRPDGYHELETVFQRVSLCDLLTVSKLPRGGLTLTSDLIDVPTDENIITRAYYALKKEVPSLGGLAVTLEKHIPTQAGMGGGSADCAAFLMAANQLYDLGLDRCQLIKLGAHLGADVPACLMDGASLGRGIGEKLTPIKSTLTLWFAVVKPSVAFSTPQMFQKLDAPDFGEIQQLNAEAAAGALEAGDLDGICRSLYNVFEAAAEDPVINTIKAALLEQGAYGSLMTGSGSCVFGIFADKENASKAAGALQNRWQTFVCQSQNRGCTLD